MKIMFAVTHKEGNFRKLSFSNQGRNHFETREQGEHWLAACFTNPASKYNMQMVFGREALGTFEVSPIECYDHGDAVSIYVNEVLTDSLDFAML